MVMKNPLYLTISFLIIAAFVFSPLSAQENQEAKIHKMEEVEVSPTPKECSEIKINKERQICFQELISIEISQKLNYDLLEKTEKPEIKRAYVEILIDENGLILINKIHTSDKNIQSEIERIVPAIEDILPGTIHSKPVKSLFQFPVFIETKS